VAAPAVVLGALVLDGRRGLHHLVEAFHGGRGLGGVSENWPSDWIGG